MNRKIVSISFLYEGERIRIGTDRSGRFPLPKIRKNRTRTQSPSYMHPHTAKQFIEHKKVRNCDPVLTLSDGTKLRVYQGGDPTGPVTESLSIIENHDEGHSVKKPAHRVSISKTGFYQEYSDYDFGLDYFGFDDSD